MLQKVDIFARDKLLFFYIFTDKMFTMIKKKIKNKKCVDPFNCATQCQGVYCRSFQHSEEFWHEKDKIRPDLV